MRIVEVIQISAAVIPVTEECTGAWPIGPVSYKIVSLLTAVRSRKQRFLSLLMFARTSARRTINHQRRFWNHYENS
jgi:hypothetical protein